MSHENGWTLQEMARTIQADRLAEAEKYRRVTAVSGSYTSPRTLVAHALRSLATLLDGEVKPQPQPKRGLVRAY